MTYVIAITDPDIKTYGETTASSLDDAITNICTRTIQAKAPFKAHGVQYQRNRNSIALLCRNVLEYDLYHEKQTMSHWASRGYHLV